MPSTNYQADVLIAGGGIAGISTALELLDAGKKVIILERDVPDHFGGLAKWSFGGMFFVNSKHQQKRGIKDSIDLATKDWFAAAEFGPNDHWPKAWATKYIHQCTDHVYGWLRERKVNFFPVIHWVERGMEKQGNSVPRFHMVWGTGHGLVERLVHRLHDHARKQNFQICFHHKVEEILVQAQTIKGLRGKNEQTGEDFEAHAEVVVVATGGIMGNIKMVKDNWFADWGEAPKTLLNGSHQFALGDLHVETEKLGGRITHLDKQWNYAAGVHHPKPYWDNHGLSLVPPKSALWLNYKGERIGPKPLVTAFDTRFLVEQICKQDRKYSWQILNKKIAVKELAVSGSEYNEAIRDKKLFLFLKNILLGNKKLVNHLIEDCKDFVIAHSVDELVDKMNALQGDNAVDKNVVNEVIRAYDKDTERGPGNFKDQQLKMIEQLRKYRGDKVRTSKFQKILDPKAMPLIAIREFIVSRKSLGGIQTDLECRVLTDDDRTIPGLYAVGEAAGYGGGGSHGLRSLEGTFLGTCVLTGRVAARAIIGKKL